MTAVLFVPGLSILLGIYGYLFGSSRPEPTAQRTADPPSVEAFIPALNEEETIAYAIGSLARQSCRPEKLTIVDDGSTDATPEVVAAVRDHVDLDIEFVCHEEPGSKTKRLKEVTRASSAEKIFVLDADTYLESERYLERVLDAHEDGDVGCSFGIVRPDSRSARESFVRRRLEPLFPEGVSLERIVPSDPRERSLRGRIGYRVTRWPVEQYRSVMYGVEQSFFKESQMRLVGTTLFPAGCGVLYDRGALRAVVDDFEASLGDQLTNSEDVFIGFSLVDRGFANVQVGGVTMRTAEPSVGDLSRQTYLWSSSYLQSTYYYRSFSERLRARTGDVTDGIEPTPGSGPEPTREGVGSDGGEASSEQEAEPATDGGSGEEPSAEASTRRAHGPTLGAVVASQVVDGLYPTALLVVSLLTALAVTPVELLIAVVAVEFALFSLVAGAFARRRITLGALLVAIPVRLFQLPAGVYVYARVATELLVGNRNWRK